jgi:hypothetical protein
VALNCRVVPSSRIAVSGDNVMVATSWRTSTAAVSAFPAAVATMFATPALTALTHPAGLTVAMFWFND